MQNEFENATELRDKWVRIGQEILGGTIPSFSTCDYCRGMAADCTSTRKWVKCRKCLFREPCFAITRVRRLYDEGLPYEEFAKMFVKEVSDKVETIYEENYNV